MAIFCSLSAVVHPRYRMPFKMVTDGDELLVSDNGMPEVNDFSSTSLATARRC